MLWDMPVKKHLTGQGFRVKCFTLNPSSLACVEAKYGKIEVAVFQGVKVLSPKNVSARENHMRDFLWACREIVELSLAAEPSVSHPPNSICKGAGSIIIR